MPFYVYSQKQKPTQTDNIYKPQEKQLPCVQMKNHPSTDLKATETL